MSIDFGEASVLPVDGVYGEVLGSGPPVVLTHDGLLHSESWDGQFGVLAADHRVARWDRRGYGRSPRPTGEFSSVEDLAAVVRAVSDAPAVLVGCSFGGVVTVQCALDHPRLAAALVLVGPVVRGLPALANGLDPHRRIRRPTRARSGPGVDGRADNLTMTGRRIDADLCGPAGQGDRDSVL